MNTLNENDKQTQGYESRDINLKLVIAVGLTGVMLLVLVLIGLDQYFTAVTEKQIEEAVLVPVSKDLLALRAHEDSLLDSYGVVDSARGIYRIPIDSAIALLVAENRDGRTKPAANSNGQRNIDPRSKR